MPTSPSAVLQRGEQRSPPTSEDHACSLNARAFGRANSFSIAKVALQVAAITLVTCAAAATDTATLTDRQGSTASGAAAATDTVSATLTDRQGSTASGAAAATDTVSATLTDRQGSTASGAAAATDTARATLTDRQGSTASGAAAATDTVRATLTDRQGSTANGSFDPSRPGYHYTRPLGWQNDPVPFQGLDGTHHLFTLCDPNATTQWSLPSDHTAWCHATSSGVHAPSRHDSTQLPGVPSSHSDPQTCEDV
jgi:sucrose-6-phosphate hydrolase SacC (GH32 family)